MVSKNLTDIKKKYAISKHHAWAGSILLAILLAIRIFLDNYEINIDDNIFLAIGISILIYISISLILTYKYRSGLTIDEKTIISQYSLDDVKNKKIETKIEKERLKTKKKKNKGEIKILKKSKF